MAYSNQYVTEVLLKADRALHKLGTLAEEQRVDENDIIFYNERIIIYLLRQAVVFGRAAHLGEVDYDLMVGELLARCNIYEFGTLNPIYSGSALGLALRFPYGLEDYTTDDLVEGVTNLYYTDERAQDAAAALFDNNSHTGISFYYDDAANKIYATVAANNIYSTDGTLAANRTVSGNNRSLSFSGVSSFGISAYPSGNDQGVFNLSSTNFQFGLSKSLGSSFIGIQKSTYLGSDVVQLTGGYIKLNGYVLTTSDGDAGALLTTNGSGVSSWTDGLTWEKNDNTGLILNGGGISGTNSVWGNYIQVDESVAQFGNGGISFGNDGAGGIASFVELKAEEPGNHRRRIQLYPDSLRILQSTPGGGARDLELLRFTELYGTDPAAHTYINKNSSQSGNITLTLPDEAGTFATQEWVNANVSGGWPLTGNATLTGNVSIDADNYTFQISSGGNIILSSEQIEMGGSSNYSSLFKTNDADGYVRIGDHNGDVNGTYIDIDDPNEIVTIYADGGLDAPYRTFTVDLFGGDYTPTSSGIFFVDGEGNTTGKKFVFPTPSAYWRGRVITIRSTSSDSIYFDGSIPTKTSGSGSLDNISGWNCLSAACDGTNWYVISIAS